MDSTFYIVATLAIMLIGISKAGFGGSTGVLAMPLMTLALPARTSAAILLPLLCIMDLFALWAYRRHLSLHHLGAMLPAAALGIGVGFLTFEHVDARALQLIVGIMALAVAAQNFARELFPAPASQKVRRWTGVFWGALAGYTGFVAHAGGPPLITHLLSLKLERSVFQAATIMFLAMVNYAKLPLYGALGLFTPETLQISAIMTPLAFAMMWLGLALHKRVNRTWFYRIINAGLVLTGLKLVFF